MRTSDFDFSLPEDRIALRPARPRDAARLLRVGADAAMTDLTVRDLPRALRPGDVLVFNDTRVIPARLRGRRVRDGHEVEVEATLLEPLGEDLWSALMRPGRRLRPGDALSFKGPADRAGEAAVLDALVDGKAEDGTVRLRFALGGEALKRSLQDVGGAPLPPYIAARRREDEDDVQDYQTVFALNDGSIAAPTAGLHFTPELLHALRRQEVSFVFVTLHVGAGTFLPVKTENVADHHMHAETGRIGAEAARALNAAKDEGRRIVCVGTTALRLLESAVDTQGRLHPFVGETSIFITPGHVFRTADLLFTNLHLPRSTLLMLVSAFAGETVVRRAYRHAVEAGYRFYSYGDATLFERSAG